MSDTTLTPQTAADHARKLLEADVEKRVEAVRVAAAAVLEVDAAEQRMKDAAASYESAFRAAVTAGWSEKDLKTAGLRSPGPSTPKTRRRRGSSADGATEPTA
jgi:hypothetical protein